MYKVQSVIFRKKLFSLHLSKEWLKKHHYKDKGVDDTQNFYRFRQYDPKTLEKQGYKHFITKKLGKSGVELIIAYKDSLKGGKLSAEDIGHFIQHSYSSGKEFKDWKLDKELSDSQVQVYHNAKGEAVVVHRGSQDVQDWKENALYALGVKSGQPRLEHSKEIQKKAESKYGAKHVSTIGHSKGAHHAEEVGQHSKEVITLNKPVTPSQILKKVPEKQTDIRTTLDPVSILRPLQSGKKSKTIKSKTLNPIVEHGTAVLKRLKPSKLFGAGTTQGRPRIHFEDELEERYATYIQTMRYFLSRRTWSRSDRNHFSMIFNMLRRFILEEADIGILEHYITFIEEEVLDNPHIASNAVLTERIEAFRDRVLYPVLREAPPEELDLTDPETKEGSGRGLEMCLYCI